MKTKSFFKISLTSPSKMIQPVRHLSLKKPKIGISSDLHLQTIASLCRSTPPMANQNPLIGLATCCNGCCCGDPFDNATPARKPCYVCNYCRCHGEFVSHQLWVFCAAIENWVNDPPFGKVFVSGSLPKVPTKITLFTPRISLSTPYLFLCFTL